MKSSDLSTELQSCENKSIFGGWGEFLAFRSTWGQVRIRGHKRITRRGMTKV